MKPGIRLILALTMVVAACSGEATPDSITLVSHDSFVGSVTEETFAAFTAETGVAVEVIAAGDAGAMVTQAVLTKDNPIGDVLFGVDDTFLSRALDNDVFIEHRSPHLQQVEDGLRPGTDLVTPISFGDVCFNFDKEFFASSGLEVPQSLEDLTADDYAGLVTVEHPATSSPGLAFMLATIDHFGEDGWLDWWADMRDSELTVVSDWDTAYYGEFTRYGGDSPVVMSYASSPPAEVIFADEPVEQAPTGVIEAGCYRQIEYAGILNGTEHSQAAGELIDFMLSVDFQETVPTTWFVFPANRTAAIPDVFIDNTSIPGAPSRFDAGVIAENRDRWIAEWVEVMEG